VWYGKMLEADGIIIGFIFIFYIIIFIFST
jgi:hypothetical protein